MAAVLISPVSLSRSSTSGVTIGSVETRAALVRQASSDGCAAADPRGEPEDDESAPEDDGNEADNNGKTRAVA
jgi:hypothetical protein